MCHELVSTKKKKIEKYIRGFPEGIKGNVTSSKPANLHDAINMAQELIEQGVQAKALRFMLQPQLRVEATLGTYHGAIGARHIISRVRVLLECDMLWLWESWALQE
ncbi:hypothetical protein Tco_1100849 [Tanacetum coccineum]